MTRGPGRGRFLPGGTGVEADFFGDYRIDRGRWVR